MNICTYTDDALVYLKSGYFLMALPLCDSKLNMFGLRTKQDIWGFHLGLLETLIATFTAAYSGFCWDASCLITRHLRHQTRLIFVSFPQYPGWHELVILAAQNWSHTGSWICLQTQNLWSCSHIIFGSHLLIDWSRKQSTCSVAPEETRSAV